jgi:hypothetical protein
MQTGFFRQRHLRCSGVAKEYYLGEITGDIAVCINFEMHEVKVPLGFSGT